MTVIRAVALALLLASPLAQGFVGPRYVALQVPTSKSSSARLQPTAPCIVQHSATRLHHAVPGKINKKIDLISPKVATTDNPSAGEKVVYCRCWKSGTFPAHNKEMGDNVGPLIVSVEKKSEVEKPDEPSPEEAASDVVEPAEISTDAEATSDEKVSLADKVKKLLGLKNENADGLTTRERLGKMGLSALLSYGWVSNMSYAVMLSLSWYGFSKKTGLSPLAPGQWKPFLAVYAGFYVFNNIIRPLRFGASVVVSKYFDNFVSFIQNKTKLSRKWSIGVVVLIANVFGTFAAMGLGVSLASAAAGVPIFPPKA